MGGGEICIAVCKRSSAGCRGKKGIVFKMTLYLIVHPECVAKKQHIAYLNIMKIFIVFKHNSFNAYRLTAAPGCSHSVAVMNMADCFFGSYTFLFVKFFPVHNFLLTIYLF